MWLAGLWLSKPCHLNSVFNSTTSRSISGGYYSLAYNLPALKLRLFTLLFKTIHSKNSTKTIILLSGPYTLQGVRETFHLYRELCSQLQVRAPSCMKSMINISLHTQDDRLVSLSPSKLAYTLTSSPKQTQNIDRTDTLILLILTSLSNRKVALLCCFITSQNAELYSLSTDK